MLCFRRCGAAAMIYAEDLLKSGRRRRSRRTAPLFGRLGGLARELSMAIGITFLEKCGEGCRNTLVLCDWKGKRVLTYAKVHTCEFGEEADLMLKGAELILVPNACPMEINRLSQLRARAFENMIAICTCNYSCTVPDCNGGSTVFDGVAYLPDLPGSRDMCILKAGPGEEICLADIDLSMLRRYRKSEVHGNAYRRPEKYGLLTGRDIEEPFVRSDHKR